MRVDRLPLVGAVLNSGADDHVFDALLLCGPLVVALIALFGRTPVTTALAGGYVAVFVGSLLSKSLR